MLVDGKQIRNNTLNYLKLDTATYSGATQGKYLSINEAGKFTWNQVGGSITVTDYLTGDSVSNVENLIFRGGVITTPTGTATGVLSGGVSPSVIIWVPAPNYVPNFNPSMSIGFDRYISQPTLNSHTSSISPGVFEVGDWSVYDDYQSSIKRYTFNDDYVMIFQDLEFSCFDQNTTLDVFVYNYNDIISQTSLTITSIATHSVDGIYIDVSQFSNDNDRYKASVSGYLYLGQIFPNGGRFSWLVSHTNGPIGTFTYSSGDKFYDSDGTYSSSSISGTVSFDESSPNLKYYSGVAFYDLYSTFGFTVSDVRYINEITFPATKQIDVVCTNMLSSSTNDGFTDGTKIVGSAFSGWSIDWNSTSLTYSNFAIINQVGYFPNFTLGNTISSVANSYMTSNLYDWSIVQSKNSDSKLLLIDTYTPSSVLFNNNPIDSENGRLQLNDVTQSFSSTQSLTDGELQYIFGRIIYPQQDFTIFHPMINSTNLVDYSSMSGISLTFSIYTDINSGSTSFVNFDNYRWYVTSYGKSSDYSSSFSNGIFTINSNFTEGYLHYDGVNSVSGSGDLVILIGIDSTSNNASPDKYLFVSGDPVIYKTRQNPITYNFNNPTESSKNIQWSKGTLSAVVRKVWLYIGYKNSAIGKTLRMTNISLS